MLRYIKYKQQCIGLTLHLIILLYATSLFAGQATLSWMSSSTNADGTLLTDLAGYKIYYGTELDEFSNTIDVGNVTNYQINNLADGLTHFFAITAYDTQGNESGYSNIIGEFIQTSLTTSEETCDDAAKCWIVEVQVGSDSDAAEEYASGKMNITSSDLEMTYDGLNQVVGIRFNQVEIPQWATITNAYVQFQADETDSEYTYLTIQGEDVNHAQTFTSKSGNISSRPLTYEEVIWEVLPWTIEGEAGVDQQTPDIASVIQEIVNREGWRSRNSLAIIIAGTGKRTAESYNGVKDGAPTLHIEFIPLY